MTYPPAVLPATEVRSLASRCVPQTYQISVALPASYPFDLGRTYPTVYLLDANWSFGLVTDLTRIMAVQNEIPETVLVGIGYPVPESLREADTTVLRLRARDFTPVPARPEERDWTVWLRMPTLETGGAAAFFRFLETELIPLVEREYRSDPARRVLAGHSLGGLFTLYALFQDPPLFHACVSGSPSLWYANRAIFDLEAAFSQTHRSLPARVYLGVGAREENLRTRMVSNLERFANCLAGRAYQGLALTQQLAEGSGHCGFAATAFQAGLQAGLA